MYSPALIKRRSETRKVRKKLNKGDSTIQAYLKFPARLMVKNDYDKEYSPEFILNTSNL